MQFGFDFWLSPVRARAGPAGFGRGTEPGVDWRAMRARLDLTAQKSLQRAYQRDPEAIERWPDKKLEERLNTPLAKIGTSPRLVHSFQVSFVLVQ